MATGVPRTMLHSTDLDGDDFAFKDGKIVSKQGFAGPFQITEGTIADYENQSGKPELVWLGGTESDPTCAWVVFPDGTAVKIKRISISDDEFCPTVKECIIADLELGGGGIDQYVITLLAGPTWQVLSVTYGPEDTEIDFSGETVASLIELMGELNDSGATPDGWLWSISGGYLVLSVPHGTGVTLIELPGGLEMAWTEPDIEGEPASELAPPIADALAGPMDVIIQQYEALLEAYTGLLGTSVAASVNDTEAEIETEFTAFTTATVRWTDADGDPRVSYKTPGQGWYHPVHKAIDSVSVYSYVPNSAIAVSTTVDTTINLTGSGIPANARFVDLRVTVSFSNFSASSGNTSIKNGTVTGRETTENVSFHYFHTHAELVASERVYVENATLRIKNDGTLDIKFTVNKAIDHNAQVHVRAQGWSR